MRDVARFGERDGMRQHWSGGNPLAGNEARVGEAGLSPEL